MQPPPPAQPLKSFTHAQRIHAYGRFKWTPTPTATAPGRISVDPHWLSANIVIVELRHLSPINGGKPIRARVHRLVAEPLERLFDAWRDAKLLLHVQSWDGALVCRFKRGRSGYAGESGGKEVDLSNHSWGSAIDINARWNPLGRPPAALGKSGCVLPLVEIANECGWAWGGHFSSGRVDAMHFECVRPTAG